jgi:hypothetical protein
MVQRERRKEKKLFSPRIGGKHRNFALKDYFEGEKNAKQDCFLYLYYIASFLFDE